MMALPVTNFVYNNRKLKSIFQCANRYGFTTCEYHKYSHMVCKEMLKEISPYYRRKIEFLEITMCFSNIVNHMFGKPFVPIEVGTLEKNKKTKKYDEYCYSCLFECFDELLARKKILFIMLNIDDYLPVKSENKKTFMVSHGTCLFFIPVNDHYQMFYINSHGKSMHLTNFYDFPLTKTRDKHVVFDEPLDIKVWKFLITKYNRRENSIRIQYEGNKRDTYFGADLQSGDGHGVCFIYPFVIWYYFSMYYNKKRVFDNVTIPSVKQMLLSGDINKFVHSCFIDFNEHYCEQFLENIREFRTKGESIITLEKYIYDCGTHFIKTVTNSILNYFTQAYYMKKIIK